MPSINAIADDFDTMSGENKANPSDKPIIIPSGKLCNVMAVTSKNLLCLPDFFVKTISDRYKKIIPASSPMATYAKAGLFCCSQICIAGKINDKNDAESIIPPDNPNAKFSILGFVCLKNKTDAAPMLVARNGTTSPIIKNITLFIFCNVLILYPIQNFNKV